MVLLNKNFMRKILKREEVWCALNGNADEGMCMGSVPQLLLTNVKGALIWIYTGCVYEDLLSQNSKWYTECTAEILKLCDVLVDGPYIESLKDISLKFRGSANQRIIKLSNLEV